MSGLMIARVRASVESGYLNKVQQQACLLASREQRTYLLLRGKDSLVCQIITSDGSSRKCEFKYRLAGKGLWGALLDHWFYFQYCMSLYLRIQPSFIYIRRIIPLLPQWLLFMAWCKFVKVRVSYEIPTYPWYQEFQENALFKLLFPMEWLFNKFALYLADSIPVVLSQKDTKLHRKMIPFTNGMRARTDISWLHADTQLSTGSIFRFGTISGFRFWHGFERVLYGLAIWKAAHPGGQIELIAVGAGPELDNMKKLADDLGIKDWVRFTGRLALSQGLELIANCNYAIGTLGSHRKGMDTGMPLKETDFISIGIPFVTDVAHQDFESLSGIRCIAQDESPLNFDGLISFLCDLNRNRAHQELLAYAQGKGSWNHTFGPVADCAVPKKDRKSVIWKVAR